MFLVLV